MDVWRHYRVERPHPDAVWCDKCLRWETGAGRFRGVARPHSVRLLRAIARVFYRIGGWWSERADHAQVRHNKRLGVYDVRTTSLPGRKVA